MPKDANKLHAWLFVVLQAVILVLLVFFPKNTLLAVRPFLLPGTILELIGALGVVFSAITIRSSLTAMPLPKKHGRLGKTGLYKYVRHPMYTSLLVLSLGIAVHRANILSYLLVVGLYVLFYYKSNYEERYLNQKYADYRSYAERTPRFIPFVKH